MHGVPILVPNGDQQQKNPNRVIPFYYEKVIGFMQKCEKHIMKLTKSGCIILGGNNNNSF